MVPPRSNRIDPWEVRSRPGQKRNQIEGSSADSKAFTHLIAIRISRHRLQRFYTSHSSTVPSSRMAVSSFPILRSSAMFAAKQKPCAFVCNKPHIKVLLREKTHGRKVQRNSTKFHCPLFSGFTIFGGDIDGAIATYLSAISALRERSQRPQGRVRSSNFVYLVLSGFIWCLAEIRPRSLSIRMPRGGAGSGAMQGTREDHINACRSRILVYKP